MIEVMGDDKAPSGSPAGLAALGSGIWDLGAGLFHPFHPLERGGVRLVVLVDAMHYLPRHLRYSLLKGLAYIPQIIACVVLFLEGFSLRFSIGLPRLFHPLFLFSFSHDQ